MRCLWFQVLSNLLNINKKERQFIEALFCLGGLFFYNNFFLKCYIIILFNIILYFVDIFKHFIEIKKVRSVVFIFS
jgi:hypothetical protein